MQLESLPFTHSSLLNNDTLSESRLMPDRLNNFVQMRPNFKKRNLMQTDDHPCRTS